MLGSHRNLSNLIEVERCLNLWVIWVKDSLSSYVDLLEKFRAGNMRREAPSPSKEKAILESFWMSIIGGDNKWQTGRIKEELR